MQTEDILYYTPLSCAVAVMAALEACGHPYQAHRLVMSPDGAGDEAFSQLSPLRQVPVLQSGGLMVRETGAILDYLVERHPEANLLPGDPEGRRAALEWIGLLGGTVHPVFRLMFRPARWVGGSPDAQAALRLNAAVYLRRIFADLDRRLTGRDWPLGERSAIDFYLFAFTRWAGLHQLTLGPALAGFHARVQTLPALQRALALEKST